MRASQIIQHVLDNGVQLVRIRKKEYIKGQPIEYDVKDAFTGKAKGWFYFDTFTASAMKSIYSALNSKSQESFDKLSLPTLVDFTWKHIS